MAWRRNRSVHRPEPWGIHTIAMSTSRQSVRVTIMNRLGLHARPAMSFVDTANGFKSNIMVCKGNQKVDGKSIMQLMMLSATQGTELDLVAEGQDAEQAIAALRDLVERKFDEE